MEKPENLLETAAEAAKLAGNLLQSRAGKAVRIQKKSSAVDLVTEMDLKAEQVILDLIHSRFPGHNVLSEEKGQAGNGSGSPYLWIIDPLDGTTNYAHGYPMYCVSIAVAREGAVVAAAVYHPPMQEMFTAVRGQGARLNDREIRISAVADLGESLLVTGFPYDVRSSPETNLAFFSRFLTRAQAVRRDGSAALNLAYVAAGRFDGFWELKLQPWDVAAGLLLVEEAGGSASDFLGGPVDVYGKQIVASNGRIHSRMLAVLNGDGA